MPVDSLASCAFLPAVARFHLTRETGSFARFDPTGGWGPPTSLVQTHLGSNGSEAMKDQERLLEELRMHFLLRERELEVLHDVELRILGGDHKLDSTLALIVDGTRDLLGAAETHILLKRGSTLEMVASSSKADIGQMFPVATSVVGKSLIEQRALNIGDLTTSEYRDSYAPSEDYAGHVLRSLLAVPIIIDDSVIGILSTYSLEGDAFQAVHERIATSLAGQIAIALQRVQLFDEAKLFHEVGDLIFSISKQQTVTHAASWRILQELLGLTYVQLASAQILFIQGPGDALEVVQSTQSSDIGVRVGVNDSVCGRAVKERRTVVVGDVRKDPDYKRLLGPNIRSEIAVPILIGEEAVIGVLNIESEEPGIFDGFYQYIIENFTNRVTTLLALIKLHADVTEALELRHANDLLVAIGDQTSNLVHRLNNTVGAMRVRIMEIQTVCEEEIKSSDFLRESLDALLLLAERTLEMPKQVMSLLRSKTDLIDLNDCVHAAVADTPIPEGIEVELLLDASIPPLPLFSFDIVVQNLIRNAIDSMPDGGKVTISTALIAYGGLPGGYAQLLVKDTGLGMDDTTRANLFAINFTTKSEKGGKGLGLGLWWVRNFVRRAGGEISVSSALGHGTEVIVKLPIDLAGTPD
jgi:signal transduction histidine kinase